MLQNCVLPQKKKKISVFKKSIVKIEKNEGLIKLNAQDVYMKKKV